MSRLRLKRIPFVPQLESSDCAAACLASVLSAYGHETTLADVHHAAGGISDGMNARQLLDAAARFGMRGRGVRLELDDFGALPRGAVLHWGFNHFVVYDGMVPGGVRIVDPAAGPRRVPARELREQFTGVALLFEPGETFRRQRLNRRPLLAYFRRLSAHRPVLWRTVLLTVVLQLLGLGLPLLVGVMVDRVIPFGAVDLLALLAGGLFCVAVFHTLTLLLRSWLLNWLRTAVDSDLSLGFVETLTRLPLPFFLTRPSGDLLARFESSRTLRTLLTSTALSSLMDGVMVLLYLALIAVTSPRLGLASVILAALQVLLFLIFRRSMRELAARELELQSRAQASLVEILTSIESLKAMGAASSAAERWSNRFVDELNASLQRARMGSIAGALTSGFSLLAPITILLLGANEVMAGRLTLGSMLAVNALSAAFLQPVSSLVAVAFQLQEVRSHVERIDDVLSATVEQPAGSVRSAPTLSGRIELDNVSFRYRRDDPPVVSHISLRIEPGQKVAIVGASGAGKSTLARLLVGLYVPQEGSVRLDGHDLHTLALDSVRRQIGVVTQDTRLFSASVRDNIAIAAPDADLDRVVRAAQAAAVHEEITQLPMGYETVLAEGGGSLSGGQRQRIAIARALVREPRLVLFDEATSDLDSVAESRVMAALAALAATRIVIAHRLSTIADADQILVLSGGTIVERGGHSELLAQRGEYARLAAGQFGTDPESVD